MGFNATQIINKSIPVDVLNTQGYLDTDVSKITNLVPVYGIEELWEQSFTAQPRKIRVSDQGEIYIAFNNGKIKKFNKALEEIIEISAHTGSVTDLIVDERYGNIISCGYTPDNSVKISNSAGGQVIKFTGHTDSVNAIAYDVANGFIYSCSADKTVKKIKVSDGTQVWSYTLPQSGESITYKDGFIYIAHDANLTKLNYDGSMIWTKKLFDSTISVVKTNNNTVLWASDISGNIKKIDLNGNALFSYYSSGFRAFDINIDENNSVYIVGLGGLFLKLDTNGRKMMESKKTLYKSYPLYNNNLRGVSPFKDDIFITSQEGMVKKIKGHYKLKGYSI